VNTIVSVLLVLSMLKDKLSVHLVNIHVLNVLEPPLIVILVLTTESMPQNVSVHMVTMKWLIYLVTFVNTCVKLVPI
jgi:hypothetical protein